MAAQEQASAIGQINRAMGEVDQVTQRNAAAAEELSSTAEEVAAAAAVLNDQVAWFKVAGAAGPARPHSV